jgi:NADH-quinone oxidoreductase subunit C
MTPTEIIALLQTKFGPAVTAAKADALDPYVVVDPVSLVNICRFLCDESQLRFDLLNDLSGTDYLETDAKKVAKAGFDPHIEVVYHLSSFAFPGRRFTLKVILPRENPEVPTVSDIWRTADWHERECYDFYGVNFTGHPDLRRILLNDDWVGHPMRKDYEFPLEYHDIRCR